MIIFQIRYMMLKVIAYFTLQMAKLRFKLVPPVDDLKKELIKPETLTQVVVPLDFNNVTFP